MENSLAQIEHYQNTLSADNILSTVKLVHQVMSQTMLNGIHYGKIPGCGDKPSLLKPGAEKICMVFRLSPKYEVVKTDLPGGHREYDVTCTLTHIPTGAVWGSGVGCCSTMERKYRYAGDEYIDNKKTGKKLERQNLEDVYNTVLKMAKKRAHVDAVLTTTGASDIFRQDIDDEEDAETHGEKPKPDIKEPQAKTPEPTQPPATEQRKETHPPQGEKLISEPQRKRLYAIAKEAGWEDDHFKNFILGYGFESSKDIPVSVYNEICNGIQNPSGEAKS